jgi:hypothetical protein
MSTPAKWTKLGLCFVPSGHRPWMRSHAAVPIAQWLEEDRFKVYFSTRDEHNRSYTGYVVMLFPMTENGWSVLSSRMKQFSPMQSSLSIVARELT